MTWITSWTVEQWVAVLAIAGAAIAWTTSGLVRAFTYRREQQQREWTRVYELLRILYNKDHEHGHWAQIAAINELKTLTHNREGVTRIAKAIREFWAQDGGNQLILSELDLLIAGRN